MGRWFSVICAFFWATAVSAGEVSIAVASNFAPAAERLAADFETATGHSVSLVQGATGRLAQQIEAGEPFDVFLAADEDRPAQLVRDGRASESATYAIGALALVSRFPIDRETASDVFAEQTVALADPILAPYGKAATTAMERLRLDTATFQPVVVANVGQVASVFEAGDADLAFVAASDVARIDPPQVLDLSEIAPRLRQDAALLNPDNPAASEFWSWLFSDEGAVLILAAGYDLP